MFRSILKKSIALFTSGLLLLPQNAQAFQDNFKLTTENLLSPQLILGQQIFINNYQQITKAPRWLDPDIVGFFGGTGGNIAGNILSFSDLNTFLTEKLFVTFIISPHDDGGSSVRQQRMLFEYLGYTLSPGDTNNIFSGLTDYFKKRILRTRFPKNISGSCLRDRLEQLIEQTEDIAKPRQLFKNAYDEKAVDKIIIEGVAYPVSFNKKRNVFIFGKSREAAVGQRILFKNEQFEIKMIDGKVVLCFIPEQENAKALEYDLKKDLNWQRFKYETLALAEGFDNEFIKNTKPFPGKIVDISQGSMGNFLIAAKMIQTGAYDPKRKGVIDQTKYHQGIQELCELLDIDNGFVSFSTFDPATLYVKLASIAIEKRDKVFLLNGAKDEVLRKNGITVKKIDPVDGVYDIHCEDAANKVNTSFDLNIREYIEGYAYRNKPGRRDSYSEVGIPLKACEQYPVMISYNGLQIKVKISDGQILELEYAKGNKNIMIKGDRLTRFETSEQILFAFPEEISSMPEEELRGLPRFYIDKQKAQLNVVLDTRGSQ